MVRTTQPVALVTGGSSGIGASAAVLLAGQGFTVYATARRVERLATLTGHGVHTVAADLTDPSAPADLVARVADEQGRLDVLVNNAGYGAYGSLEEMPMREARRQVEVNLFALAGLTQAVLPLMRSQRSGRIINISSIGGRFGEPLGGWYHATKFAVEGLSDSLRLELAPHGIDVVVVQPGAIATDWGPAAAAALQATSGSGAYTEQARLGAAVLTATNTRAVQADVIGDVIVRAATARRPRTRYVAPRSAAVLLLMRRWLPDRAFDRLFMTFYRAAARPVPSSATISARESTSVSWPH